MNTKATVLRKTDAQIFGAIFTDIMILLQNKL